MRKANLYIGTSGWHYNDWIGLFYPPDITGYYELKFHSQHFNTVENNSSFYRIAQESTYKTWDRMTPESYKFSIKLNKLITHEAKLELNDDVREKVDYILTSIQILKAKLGAIVIQLPASFKYDLPKLERFLAFFRDKVNAHEHKLDIAIEFRNKHWFVQDVYTVLKKYNVALVAGQSSRYPLAREITADIVYIRMHGPDKLFASKYNTEQLTEWADYIKGISKQVKRVYVYFNNDFYGYALENAKELARLCNLDS
ncbi:MAG TPA: DUF72 domain-containing protein [Candidatus Limnocylindrales bacterium]|nr:DUF72 domain-containing protein [Candidatus Limnocylindrales bacterium]